MQHLVQRPSPHGGTNGVWGVPSRRPSQLFAVLACVGLAAWVSVFVLPGIDEPPVPSPTAIRRPPTHTKRETGGNSAGDNDPDPASPEDGIIDRMVLPPWGYNANRNVPRWRAIAASLHHDVHVQRDTPPAFTLVDYGADAGYFSVSVAKAFPQSLVMAVELGGKGGKIWSKNATLDVHREQETAIAKHGVEANMNLCQTLVKPDFFATLRSRKQRHTYQFVLSVFHWFKLPTRSEFERVVVDLFANARTTFIELPTIGDRSKLIRQQTGYENWSKWYDGRTDVAEVLRAAIKAQGMTASVRVVASLPWLRWERVVYRVDVQEVSANEPDASLHFDCPQHRQVLECRRRAEYQTCPHRIP